ncbi:MAG: hypothetical protein LBD04_12225 [Synergistaceae bacterium]|nr:hypothetical protein [Synergistaceae bacterium]
MEFKEVWSFFSVTKQVDIATGLLVVVALAYAIGDFVSNKTKAIFSMIFVTGAIFLVAFWCGLPKDIFKITALDPYYGFVMPFILVHMGTLMKVRKLVSEWKTVLIAFLGLVGLSFGLYYVAGPIIGHVMALTAAGPISGGIVATYIVREAAESKGLAELATFAALLLVIQNFVGLPVASYCLKVEGRRLLKVKNSGGGFFSGKTEVQIDPEVPTIRLFPALPKNLQTTFVLMFKAFLVGYIAVWSEPFFPWLTGKMGYAITIHKLVLALIYGIIFYEVGFLEHDIFTKANVGGYAMFFCLIPVWAGLTNADPASVAKLTWPILLSFGVSLVCLAITSLILGLVLGYSWAISMAISVTCLFGFPATYILTDEVSTAITSTEEDKKYVFNSMLPKMLIGGFTTVTIGSVVLAGQLAQVIMKQ